MGRAYFQAVAPEWYAAHAQEVPRLVLEQIGRAFWQAVEESWETGDDILPRRIANVI